MSGNPVDTNFHYYLIHKQTKIKDKNEASFVFTFNFPLLMYFNIFSCKFRYVLSSEKLYLVKSELSFIFGIVGDCQG